MISAIARAKRWSAKGNELPNSHTKELNSLERKQNRLLCRNSDRSDRLRTDETHDQASVTREGEDSRRLSFSSIACMDSPVSIAVELAMVRISRRLAASVSRK